MLKMPKFSGLPTPRQAPQAEAMAAEKQQLAQELWSLENQLRDAQRQVATRTEESMRFKASLEEEVRQKEEQQRLDGLNESLTGRRELT